MFCLYINYVSCGFLLYVCIACKFVLVYVIQSYYISIMYVDSFLCSNTTIVNWSFKFFAADQCDLYTNKKKKKKKKNQIRYEIYSLIVVTV